MAGRRYDWAESSATTTSSDSSPAKFVEERRRHQAHTMALRKDVNGKTAS